MCDIIVESLQALQIFLDSVYLVRHPAQKRGEGRLRSPEVTRSG